MQQILVTAIWDKEAGVWVATSDDVPGLVTEAETQELLERKLVELVPELLLENGVFKDHTPDISIQLLAQRELLAKAC